MVTAGSGRDGLMQNQLKEELRSAAGHEECNN